jgi:hypothetical protein
MENICKPAASVLPQWMESEISRKCVESIKRLKRNAQRTAKDVENVLNGKFGEISTETQTAIAHKLVELGKAHSSRGAQPALGGASSASPAADLNEKRVDVPTISFRLFDGETEIDVSLKATLQRPDDLLSTERVRMDGVHIKWTLEF